MSVQLLRREVLQNVSVITPPRGRSMAGLLWVGVRGGGGVGRRLPFCPWLGLHRTGLGSEPRKLMHGGLVCDGTGRGWR